MITFIISYGLAYNPSNDAIKLSALQALAVLARNALDAVGLTFPINSNAVAACEVAFIPFKKLITRILNAVKATNTSIKVDEPVKTFVRKLRGIRATPKKTAEEKLALAPQE